MLVSIMLVILGIALFIWAVASILIGVIEFVMKPFRRTYVVEEIRTYYVRKPPKY